VVFDWNVFVRFAEKRKALRFRSALHNLMAVSRILSPEFLRADDHLSQLTSVNRPLHLRVTWCDDTRRSTDRLSSSCFVLHRMGFFLPRELLRARWALTSPFHPCLHFSQRTGGIISV